MDQSFDSTSRRKPRARAPNRAVFADSSTATARAGLLILSSAQIERLELKRRTIPVFIRDFTRSRKQMLAADHTAAKDEKRTEMPAPVRTPVESVPKYNRSFPLLLNLILEMSEEKQQLLLRQALEISNKRLNKRIPCLIYAVFRINGEVYSGFILDINDYGAFIETDEKLGMNTRISISFFDPFAPREILLHGRIVWQTASGIGVRFTNSSIEAENLKKFLTEFKKYEGVVIRS